MVSAAVAVAVESQREVAAVLSRISASVDALLSAIYEQLAKLSGRHVPRCCSGTMGSSKKVNVHRSNVLENGWREGLLTSWH